MSKLAEEKAMEAYPPTPLNVSLVDYNLFKRTFYAKGYDQCLQDIMEKAKAWFIQQHTGMFNSFKQYIEQQ